MQELTSEHFDSVGLTISQPKNGHRYGPETIALAEFCKVARDEYFAEFGTGVGVVSLMIAKRDAPKRVYAVEIQKSLYDIALKNVEENKMSEIVSCVCGDIRTFSAAHKNEFDVIAANPPFFKNVKGRVSPNAQRAAARHELHGTLKEWIESAKLALKPGGKFACVFAKERGDELCRLLAANSLNIVREDFSADSYLLSESRL